MSPAPPPPDALLAEVLQHVEDGILFVDPQGQVAGLNARARWLLGLPADAAPRQGASEVLGLRDEAGRQRLPLLLHDALGRPTPPHGMTGSLGHADGQRIVSVRWRPPAPGGHTGLLLLRDLTEQRRLSRAFVHHAQHDVLTGLLNRRAFEHALQRALADAHARDAVHTLLVLDIDEFKLVNDSGGHAAGDDLLRQFAGALRDRLAELLPAPAPARAGAEPAWLLARRGGDEFGVLLTDCDLGRAQGLAERLLAFTRQFRYRWIGKRLRLSASVGLAPLGRDCATVDGLLQAADLACRQAKDAGRDRMRVHVHDDPDVIRRRDAVQWVARIERALDEDRFQLHAQPIAALQARERGLHFEVLLRLPLDDGSLALPGAFMPAVEHYRLASRVDTWVLTHTLRWLATRPPGEVAQCAINLSGQTVGDPAALARLEAVLDASRVPPRCLCFEITETAAIAHLGPAAEAIRRLRARGCRIALDDFGAGMSSFAYLRQLPVDLLKIDGLFVRGLEHDVVNQSMLRAIQQVARVMGLQTVAEFAETEATVQWLRSLGLDHAQGYAIARPGPIGSLPGLDGGLQGELALGPPGP